MTESRLLGFAPVLEDDGPRFDSEAERLLSRCCTHIAADQDDEFCPTCGQPLAAA